MHSVYRPDTPPSANAKPDILVFRADARQRVALVCPACGKERMLDGRKLATIKQPAAMKCTCGHVFHCRFALDPPTEPLQPPSAATLASGAAAPGPVPRGASTDGGMPDILAGSMTELPVFSADRQNRFTIICPSCKDARTLDGEKLRHVAQPATMKCRCGNIFKCHFKFFEPEFPPEDPEAIQYHGEDLELPEFPQMEPDKTFSAVAREAALANRRALLSFRGRFPEEFTDSDPASQTMDPDTLLRNVQPPAPAVSKVPEDAPLPPEAFERIGFPILEDDHTTAPPPNADVAGLGLAETDEEGEEGEASRARALAVLRLANLEKKRAREAMTATRAQSPTTLIGFPETGPQEPPHHEPAAAALPPPQAQTEAPRKGTELEAHRHALERERQELEALRRRLEEERALVMQQKAELARLLRRVTALPAASQPAALPDVATFAPDASGIIQVQCPGCGSRKALKAADVATVKQPARMKCKQCNTAFSCRFSLEAPTGAGARARAAPAPRSLPEAQAIPTFYADLAGNVTLVCPSCHAANTVASETLRGVEQPARIRCGSCDTAFPCRLVLGPPAAAPRGSIASAPPKASTAAATALAAKAAPPGIHDPEDTGDPALTMQADALGRFAKPPIQHQEPSDTTAESPSGEFHTRSDEELSKTMSPERLQALFADHTEEAMALAAVSLKGDALGRYFKAPHDAELFVEDMTATLEEDSSPSQEPLEPLVPAIVADVLPVMPFETVPAPEGEDPPTYYVDESRQVMVICPKCERGRNLDFSSHAEVGPVIRTWCKCGNAYHCRLEFRRNYRKKVNFPGSFYVPANNLQGEMTVTDISLGGVGFTLPAPYGLLPDTIIDLHFTLDDLKKTPIQRRVRVRTVKGLSVGSEFLEQRGRDKDLGYYLMP